MYSSGAVFLSPEYCRGLESELYLCTVLGQCFFPLNWDDGNPTLSSTTPRSCGPKSLSVRWYQTLGHGSPKRRAASKIANWLSAALCSGWCVFNWRLLAMAGRFSIGGFRPNRDASSGTTPRTGRGTGPRPSRRKLFRTAKHNQKWQYTLREAPLGGFPNRELHIDLQISRKLPPRRIFCHFVERAGGTGGRRKAQSHPWNPVSNYN